MERTPRVDDLLTAIGDQFGLRGPRRLLPPDGSCRYTDDDDCAELGGSARGRNLLRLSGCPELERAAGTTGRAASCFPICSIGRLVPRPRTDRSQVDRSLTFNDECVDALPAGDGDPFYRRGVRQSGPLR